MIYFSTNYVYPGTKGNYKDGKEDGLHEYFNEDGSLDRTVTWKDGKKIETNP